MAYSSADADAAYMIFWTAGCRDFGKLSWEQTGDPRVFESRDSDGDLQVKVTFLDGDGNARVEARGDKPRRVSLFDRKEADSDKSAATMTVEQFAEIVNRSAWTVRNWCNQGRIRASKAGRGGNGDPWLIERAELRRYRTEGLLDADQNSRHGG